MERTSWRAHSRLHRKDGSSEATPPVSLLPTRIMAKRRAHRDDNYQSTFFDELKASSTNVPFPLQQKTAEFIASAYHARPDAADLPLPSSLAKELSAFGPVGTIGDAQNLILSSHYGTMGEFAQGVINNPGSRLSIGDVFSTLTEAGLNAFRGYDPTQSAFSTHLVHSMRDALVDARRSMLPSGSEAGLDSIAVPFEDPTDETSAWSGTTAPYGTPDGEEAPVKTWVQSLYENIAGNVQSGPVTAYGVNGEGFVPSVVPLPHPDGKTLPTGFYAPDGQGLMLGGQLNPNLSTRPIKGWKQVWVGADDIREYSEALESGVPLSSKPGLADRVATSLRSLANGLLGNDTVGGNPIGFNVQQLDAEFMGQPYGMQEVRGDPILGVRSRTLEAMEALDTEGHDFFDASGQLRALVVSPSQRIPMLMARDLRVSGRIQYGLDASGNKVARAVSSVRNNEAFGDQLDKENRAGYQAANRVNPVELEDWETKYGDVTSGPNGVPEEFADQYRAFLLDRGSAVPTPKHAVPQPQDPPMPGNWSAVRPVVGGAQPPEPPRPPVDLATPEPSDDGNSGWQTSNEAMDYLVNAFPEYAQKFLGTGPETKPAFDAWRASLSPEQRKKFDSAHAFVTKEKQDPMVVKMNAGSATPMGQAMAQARKERAIAKRAVQPAMAPAKSAEPASTTFNAKSLEEHGVSADHGASNPPTAPQGAPEPPPNFPEDEEHVSSSQATSSENSAFSGPWRQAANNPSLGVFGAGRGPSGSGTPSSLRVTSALLSDWKVRAADLSAQDAIGFRDEALGALEPLSRNGNPASPNYGMVESGHLVKDGQETLSAANVDLAVTWAQQATGQALNSGAVTEGMNANSASATMTQKVWKALDQIANKYVDALGQEDPELQLAAKRQAVAIKTVAGQIAGSVTHDMREDLEQRGDDGRHRAIRLGNNAGLAQAAIQSNPEFADWVESQPGGLNAVLRGPERTINTGTDVLNVGSGGYNSGRGRDGGGFGGNEGGRSIYQTPAGRFMMEMMMVGYGWKDTAGQVLQSAEQYGMSQASMLPLVAYGNNGPITGAAAYASQRALAQEEQGRLAYEAYGGFTNLGYAIGGGPIGNAVFQMGDAAKVATGAGIVTGGAAYATSFLGMGTALSSVAAPIGLGAAALVGTPLMGMAAFNAFTGKSPDEGLSPMNMVRAGVVGSAEFMAGDWKNGLLNTIDPIGAQGSFLDEQMSKDFGSKSPIDVYKMGLGLYGKWLPQAASWLAGETPQQKEIRTLANTISQNTALQVSDVENQLQPIQTMLGGLSSPAQSKTATQLIELAQSTGLNQAGIIGSIAGSRGLVRGSVDEQNLVQQYLALPTEEARNQFVLQSQSDAQAFSQYAPYLQGTTAAASRMFYASGMTLPQAQQFAPIIAGAAMSQGSQLTPDQALPLMRESLSLGKYATTIGSMAGQLDMMGVSNYAQDFTQLFDIVGPGKQDILKMQEIFSGNRYAWSDYGRQAGLGVYQTMQPNGLQAGTTDMSGLLMFARQNQLGQTGLSDPQTLSALGVTNPNIQNALLSGGMWAAQTQQEQQQQSYQMQGYGIQQAQLSSNLAYTNQMYGYQQQETAVNWGATQYGFQASQASLDLSNQAFAQNLALSKQQNATSYAYQMSSAAFQQGTVLEQEQFSRQDYNFGVQMNQLQYGWNLSDINLAISRSTGFDRAQLVKQRDRMVESNTLNVNHAAQDEANQEDLWKRQQDQYEKQVQYNQKMQELDLQAFKNQESQHKALADLDEKNLQEQIKVQTELHDLQLQMQKETHAHDLESLEFSQQQLDLQIAVNTTAFQYQQAMEAIQRSQALQTASFQQIVGYAPAFKDALTSFLTFMQNVINNNQSLGNNGLGQ